MTDEVSTAELLARARERLQAAGSDRPAWDVEAILAHVLGVLHVGLDERDRERPLSPEARARFLELVQRRAFREPLAYVIERVPFRSLHIAVDRRVLIPRPPTETLIELALDTARERGWTSPRIADICTGSGVVAICLAHELPGASVVATDASADALAVARLNLTRLAALGLADRVRLRHGDLTDPLAGERFEMIVSNPPYVLTGDVDDSRTPEMRHEPRLAFDGGADGLDLVRRLIGGASEHLVPGGLLAIEHGFGQHLPVAELLRAAGFTDVAWRKDVGKVDRVTYGRAPA